MDMSEMHIKELDYSYCLYTSGISEMPGISIRHRKQAIAGLYPRAKFGKVSFCGASLTKTPLLIRLIPSVNIFDVIECMVMETGIRPPELILSIIATPGDHKSFKLYYHRDQFIKGMEQIMETTSVWIITHGRNCGIVSLLGEAFHRRQENIEYQNRWCETLRKQFNRMANVSLISVVNEEDILQNGGIYTPPPAEEPQSIKLVLSKTGDDFYLNKYHNIHIVVADENSDKIEESSTECLDNPAERFRCHFENHLYTHVVPKIKLSKSIQAMRPRDLKLHKIKISSSHIVLTFCWKNPYHNSKYASLFEEFVLVVYASDHPNDIERKELKTITMRPKRDMQYCSCKICNLYKKHLNFVLYSRTLYGSSREASCHIDLARFPTFGRSPYKERNPVFVDLDMYFTCAASDRTVCVNLAPYPTSTNHRVSIKRVRNDEDSNGSAWCKEVVLDAGVNACYFTELSPSTTYEVTVSPLMISSGEPLQLTRPYIQRFTTLGASLVTNCGCGVRDTIEHIINPMVYVICGGNEASIRKVLHCLKTRSAAMLLMNGTRGAADIIAVSIDMHGECLEGENVREIIQDVLRKYLQVEMFKGKSATDEALERVIKPLLEIGMFCQRSKQVRIANIWETKVNLSKISKQLLKCWILCGGRKEKSAGSFTRDVLLSIALNNSSVAQEEIFEQSRYTSRVVTNELFETALLTKDREKFVDLFLEYGFQAHQYLTNDRIKFIFEYEDELDPYDRDFFITTTVEGIMGLTGEEEKLPDDFVQRELPQIIEHLTGLRKSYTQDDSRIIFLSRTEHESLKPAGLTPCELLSAYIKIKGKRIMERERESRMTLITYAVLMNRFKLATYLWKHSTSPLLSALFCAAMYNKLTGYCHESYQRIEARKYVSKFTDLAVKLLDLVFTENEQITHECLQCKYFDYNQRSPIEFAHGVDNKVFMGHPSCQKWITRTYYGEITLRDLTTSDRPLPDFFKILLCALLVFPMYFWINFSPIGKATSHVPKSRYHISLETGTETKSLNTGYKQSQDQSLDNLIRWSIPSRQQTTLDEIFDADKPLLEQPFRREYQGHIQDWEFLPFNSTWKLLRRSSEIFRARLDASPPLWKKLMLFWGAPVTKFSLDAFFYFLYLVMFAVVTIWPTCGNILLDVFFWLWSASITFEHTRLCYTKSKTINHLPLATSIIDILMQTIFLFGFVWMRIYGLWEGKGVSPHQAKSFVGTFLIYYFLRVFRLYYPIHPKLGPAMVKLTYMITDDFVSYLYIFIIFMIPTGVAVTAIMFPHHPLNIDIFVKVLKRGIMALFRTDIRDLDAINKSSCRINVTKQTCIDLAKDLSFSYDNDDIYSEYGIANRTCPISTWILWVFVLQYGYMSSVFLRSLLTAMFGITGRNVGAISEQIWMYDRYEIIMDYERKPRLPPPLCIISYILSAFAYFYKIYVRPDLFGDIQQDGKAEDSEREYIYEQGMDSLNEFISMLSKFTRGDTSTWANKPRWKDKGDSANIYWKLKAEEVMGIIAQENKTNEGLKRINLRSDLIQQAVLGNKFADSLMRRMMIMSIVKDTIRQNKGPKERSTSLCQLSPYPYTNIVRLALTKDQIPWTYELEAYAPPQCDIPIDSKFEDGLLRSSQLLHVVMEDDFELPRHSPGGRTGLAGRGCLPQLGSNKFLVCVLTRVNASSGITEFLAKETAGMDSVDWTILPHAYTGDLGSAVRDNGHYRLCREVNADVISNIDTRLGERPFDDLSMVEFFVQFNERFNQAATKRKPFFSHVHEGYVDDRRTTDNAWVELDIWSFHFDDIVSGASEKYNHWMPMSTSILQLTGVDKIAGIISSLCKSS